MVEQVDKNPREFIWCYVSDQRIVPRGEAKTFNYAMSCSEKDYPEKFKLFRLVVVRQGEEV